jgi:hypothetical protein
MSMFARGITAFIVVIMAATLTVAQEPKAAEQKVAVAYVHAADKKGAEAFMKMLDAEGFTVELIASGTAAEVDFSKYGLVVVGTDTERVAWKNIAPVVEKAGKPVLGLGEGGYAFFGREGLKLAIGSPWGAHNMAKNEQAAIPVEAEKSPLWTAAGIPGGVAVHALNLSGPSAAVKCRYAVCSADPCRTLGPGPSRRPGGDTGSRPAIRAAVAGSPEAGR